jgi:fatty acid desaturase
MDLSNPYAPPNSPQAGLDPATADDLTPWRLEGDTLLVRKGATLPEICIYTGQPAPGLREREQISWTPIWFKVMAVLMPPVAAYTYSMLRKSSTIELALSPAAKRRRRTAALLGLGGFALGLLLFLMAVSRHDPALTGLAFLVIVPVVVVATLRGRVFRVLGFEGLHHIRLRLTPAAAEAFAREQAAMQARK